ncbi:CGNR zinc finger domain-containing protein [Actinokineospora inagensis]|uniref:CGNR zinc finger domain-containing protein n=1 Tax=Actinokineospora inagensis TaxID=103730 RepID=UPI0005533C70|nr:CGNR zinc finger domain-containing protein [Actinokineospora inagensis]
MSTAEVSAAHDVELVLDFLNTVDVEQRTDVLDDLARWRIWLTERDLVDDPSVRATRDGLRAVVGGPHAPAFPAATVRIELVTATPTLVADTVTGAVLAAATRLSVLGEWDRLKICPADDCRWAFFDRSRNRSRTWCSMRVCGNREKARAWRERSKLGQAQ